MENAVSKNLETEINYLEGPEMRRKKKKGRDGYNPDYFAELARVVAVNSFGALLFPFMVLKWLLCGRLSSKYDGMDDLNFHPFSNFLFGLVMIFERGLPRFGVPFPFWGLPYPYCEESC